MTINIPHFDTKLQAPTEIQEQVKNSLAEYLFPDTEFAVGHIYENSITPKELEKYEEMTPQFSNGKKVYFGSEEVREKVYPNMSDGAAYGSLVFTPCKEFKELKNLRVLVVDDVTGENGGIIPNSQAKKLVGDCYGRMSPDIARELTGTTNTSFQFRMGIKPQSGNEVHRIAKGTLAPSRVLVNLGQPKLSRTEGEAIKTKMGYDLVLATSSFKGRLDESALLPGEHSLTVGVGIKTRANYGKQSLGTQVLVNYPKGVEVDILPKIEAAAKAVADKQSDPRKIAQYFIEKHERFSRLKEQNLPDIEPDELIDFEGIDQAFGSRDELESEANPAQGNEQLYELLKACTDSHPQLLEHPFVVDKLTDLLRKEWVDIATGRAIEFQAGLAQPSLELLQDEICVPYIPEGEKLIVTRSPLINSNGVIILTNKHLPEFSQEQGTVHIHPETAAAYLQADFDGDRLAYERAVRYPTLAAEIEEKHLPGQRHTDVIKADKEKYVASSFAEIALAASSNKIGIIANNIQQAVAIENEISELPEDKKLDFLFGLKGACIDLISFRVETFDIPDAKKDQCLAIQEKAEIIAGFAQQENSNIFQENVKEYLLIAKQIFFETTDILSNELQTAADGAKSAARPNEQVLDFASSILKAREVAWISDKKSDEVYSERLMETQNYSHQPTNEWGENLNGKTIDFQVARETRENHPNFNKRVILVEGKQVAPISEKDYQLPIGTQGKATLTPAPGATLTATTAKGNTVKITQLSKHDFAGESFSHKGATLTIGFVTPVGKNTAVPVAKIEDKVLGVIDKSDCQKLCAAKLLRPGAQFKCSLQSNPATTAILSIDKESLRYPPTWIRQADASKQAWIQENLVGSREQEDSSQKPRSRSPEASSKPYERPTWEKNLVKTTLKALNSIQPNGLGQRVGTVGQYIATYTDSEQGRTLKIVDANGERGILYFSQAGERPEVDNFSPREKQQFQSLIPSQALLKHLNNSSDARSLS